MKKIILNAVIVAWALNAMADPQLTSWLTAYSGQYARVYTTTANRTSGSSVTTWSNQSIPTYADIAQVLSSANWVYVRTSDLPSYVAGPWLNPQGVPGQLWPTNQHLINRFPRTPTAQTGTKTISGTGYSGLYVDGIAVFNFTDGKAWDPTNQAAVNGPHNRSTYYWHRNAPVGEGFNFDYGLGHQNPGGIYHTHQQPIALRYQLGDHVDFNGSTKNYSESASTNLAHSPILGWAYDGYPIYGPYGYSISNNAASGVRRMVSGYVKRDGNNGTDDLTNNLTTIPAWYARFRQAHFGGAYSTSTTQSRPPVSGTNTLGTYAEDFDYYGDLTNPNTSQPYVMGTNTFDLDEYNGRWCVTPEFPGGTYAYFLDIDASGTSVYPYAIAYEYYGTASGGSVSSITESVVTNFDGGADSALTIGTPTVNSNDIVTLTWSSTEGGTYQIESSTNNSTWTVQRPSVSAAAGVSTSASYTNNSISGTAYARVTRSALATYDPTGGGNGVVPQTNVVSFSLGNTAPVVANPIANQIATYGSSFSFTFDANTFTDADSGQTLSYTATSPVLVNTGIAFNSATRTFSATTVDAAAGGAISGSYTVQVVATDNGSPTLSATNSFTLTINQATASITPNAASRSYGALNPALTGVLSGFIAADSITASYSVTATTNSAIGNYTIATALSDSGLRLGNYLVTTNAAWLTVTQAALTATADSFSRAAGDANPTFTGTITGLQNSDDITANYSTTATSSSPPGTYPITVTLNDPDAKLGNYAVTTNNGTLTVTNALPLGNGVYAGNHTIHKFSAVSNQVASVSGQGNHQFNFMAFDVVGNLYVMEDNTDILKFSTEGSVSVFAAGVGGIGGLAFDNHNNLYAAIDTKILKFDTNGTSTVFATSDVGGLYFLTFDKYGRLYASTYNNSVLRYTPDGNYTTIITNIDSPAGLAFDEAGNLYVATQNILDNNCAIWKYDANGGNGTIFTTNFIGPNAIAFETNGNLLVTDWAGSVWEFSTNGARVSYSGTNTDSYVALAVWPLPSQLIPTNYASLEAYATLTVTNSLITLLTNGTINYTFTNPDSGHSIIVAVTATPLSSSNASPVFKPLDFYGPNNSPVHAAIDSGVDGGDGNWMDYYESARLDAVLVSASSGISTNSIQFGIAQMGIRPSSGSLNWTSTGGTTNFAPGFEALYPLDPGRSPLAGTNYTGLLKFNYDYGQLQFTDNTGTTGAGIVFNVQFYDGTNYVASGTNATLSASAFANGQFTFTVSGTTGASYIVQTTTDLAAKTWTSICTNTAPFNYTNAEITTDNQRFYRVIAQ